MTLCPETNNLTIAAEKEFQATCAELLVTKMKTFGGQFLSRGGYLQIQRNCDDAQNKDHSDHRVEKQRSPSSLVHHRNLQTPHNRDSTARPTTTKSELCGTASLAFTPVLHKTDTHGDHCHEDVEEVGSDHGVLHVLLGHPGVREDSVRVEEDLSQKKTV